MNKIKRIVTGHRLVECIQDFAYYSFGRTFIFSFDRQTNLDSWLIKMWQSHLGTLIHANGRLKQIIDSNKSISSAINWGLRDYQIKKGIHTFLTDSRYDDEFRDESKRPFIVKYDLDSETVEFDFSEECFNNYIKTLLFYEDILNKRFDNAKDFIYSYYEIAETDKDEVDKAIEVLSKLLRFDENSISIIEKLKEILL